jgi:hypothetical protein
MCPAYTYQAECVVGGHGLPPVKLVDWEALDHVEPLESVRWGSQALS